MQTVMAETGASAPDDMDSQERPVDLVHLARQTLNDRRVEREVLRLFLRQSAIQLNHLGLAQTDTERRAAAHTLAGAARAIGAWPVARLAGAIETAGPQDAAGLLANLTIAIDRTATYILTLLDGSDI